MGYTFSVTDDRLRERSHKYTMNQFGEEGESNWEHDKPARFQGTRDERTSRSPQWGKVQDIQST
jgi:hypothetical protein